MKTPRNRAGIIKMAKLLGLAVFIFVIIVKFRVRCTDTYFGKDENACFGKDCPENAKEATVDNQKSTDDSREDTHKNSVNEIKATIEKQTFDPNKGVQNLSNNDKTPSEINVIITFTNAKSNGNLQKKFIVTVSSLMKYTSIPLAIHIIGEKESQQLAKELMDKNIPESKKGFFRMVNLDVDDLAKKLHEIVLPMQKHFSYKPGAYYNHALFFLSIAIHRVMPESMKNVIMLDADLRFKADIFKLYQRFDMFTETNVIGIGHDLQPVYRHMYWKYRKENLGTKVGDPPPDGLNGFNSGVLLLNLNAMRKSKLYNSLINEQSVESLTKEYSVKGHLGDQDFFSLVGMKYRELFHVLPCQWNRQLCQWWKDKGYQDVFDLYHKCEGDIKILHGNCNTPIPED